MTVTSGPVGHIVPWCVRSARAGQKEEPPPAAAPTEPSLGPVGLWCLWQERRPQPSVRLRRGFQLLGGPSDPGRSPRALREAGVWGGAAWEEGWGGGLPT